MAITTYTRSNLSSENVLLTGLPRSGTTMTCWLLNKVSNVIALHEPILFKDYSSSLSLTSILEQFIIDVRTQLVTEGNAPSHAMQGKVHSNPISTPSKPRQNRSIVHNHQIVHFGKPSSESFQLAVKHNAPFTAQLEILSQIYPLGVIIRNPMSLLYSWQTVPLPIREGRLPMAERYDKKLSQKLSSVENILDRQVLILDWCFQKYQQVNSANIFRYEEIVATGGRILSSLFPNALGLAVPLLSYNRSEIYPHYSGSMLMKRLLQGRRHWQAFYSEQEVFSISEHSRDGYSSCDHQSEQ